VVKLNEPVNIFDEKMFNKVKEERGVEGGKTPAAKADAIAFATKRVITERMEEDPAFYEKFSLLIQQAIESFRAKRLSDLEYLKKVVDLRDRVVTKRHDDVPTKLNSNEDAQAYYGVIKPYFDKCQIDPNMCEDVVADMALAVQDILNRNWKVQFWDDHDAQKRAMNDIDDYLYDVVKGKRNVDISLESMDEIIERTMQVARHRRTG